MNGVQSNLCAVFLYSKTEVGLCLFFLYNIFSINFNLLSFTLCVKNNSFLSP